MVNSSQIIQVDNHASKSRDRKRKSKSKQKVSISAKESMIQHHYKGYINFAKKDVGERAFELGAKHVNLHSVLERPKHRPTSSLVPAIVEVQPRIPAQVMSSLVQSRDASRVLRDKTAAEAPRRTGRTGVGKTSIKQTYLFSKNYLSEH